MLKRYWNILFIIFGSIPFIEYLTNRLTRPLFISDTMANIMLSGIRIILIVSILAGLFFFNKFRKINQIEALTLVALMFMLIPMILSSWFSYTPSFNATFITMLIIFIALPFLRKPSMQNIETYILNIGRFYLYSALIILLISKDYVAQTSYNQGYLGLELRLNGLTNHANTLGLILIIYFLFEYFTSTVRPKIKYLNLSLCFIALLLTQSKTIWAVIGFIVVLKLFEVIRSVRKKRRLFVYFSGTSFGISLFILLLMITNAIPIIGKFISDNRLMEFTGRDVVWDFTMQYANLNKMFGYGLNLWDLNMQNRFQSLYNWTPAHAHSQIYQSLGNAGILGLIGLILFSIILAIIAVKQFKQTRGITIGLLLIFIFRAITEPVFLISLVNVSLILNIIIVTYFMSSSNPQGDLSKKNIKEEDYINQKVAQ